MVCVRVCLRTAVVISATIPSVWLGLEFCLLRAPGFRCACVCVHCTSVLLKLTQQETTASPFLSPSGRRKSAFNFQKEKFLWYELNWNFVTHPCLGKDCLNHGCMEGLLCLLKAQETHAIEAERPLPFF